MTVRAKFMCTSVEMTRDKPYTFTRRTSAGEDEKYESWPRTFKFQAVYDTSQPEDQRFCTATPSANLTMQVDNPAVSFTPGQYYYLDFNPVPDEAQV